MLTYSTFDHPTRVIKTGLSLDTEFAVTCCKFLYNLLSHVGFLLLLFCFSNFFSCFSVPGRFPAVILEARPANPALHLWCNGVAPPLFQGHPSGPGAGGWPLDCHRSCGLQCLAVGSMDVQASPEHTTAFQTQVSWWPPDPAPPV